MKTSFKNSKNLLFLVAFFNFCSCLHFSFATNTITQGQLLRDGETIISTSRKFVLGFFSPGNSTYRYVGIWYHEIPEQTVIWVANREKHIFGKSGVVTLDGNGKLVVLDENKNYVWSSNSSTSRNATVVLNDNGNLVITSNISNKALWESFTYPTDTFLPNMQVHMNVGAGENRMFSSWKDRNDPSLGRFLMGVDPRVSPQIVFWDGPKRIWRSGHWDGEIFIGMPYMTSQYWLGFKLVPEGNGKYYIMFTTPNESDLFRFQIGWDGHGEQLKWNVMENKWDILHSEPHSNCEYYNFCGSFGICSEKKGLPLCGCMKGFVPRDSNQWKRGNWTGGCVRKTELMCGRNENVVIEENDGFFKIEEVKWPDFADMVKVSDEDGCKEVCLKNCSCHAYVYVKSVGCILWTGDLIDMQHFEEGGGDFYVRVASSDLGTKKKNYVIVMIVAMVLVLLIGVLVLLAWWSRNKFQKKWWFRNDVKVTSSCWNKNKAPTTIQQMKSEVCSTDFLGNTLIPDERQTGQELSLLTFGDIAAATDNFSEHNKLGKGGFGPVYKGNLFGEEVAVKRLSRKSGQGLQEFKNEVILIAKLQHRNLVRILGCCIEGDERMLVYEYMPNKSLDSFVFDSSKQAQLDWKKRFTIIEGIARGLVYLHRDSRLRIIHRDLKASNILLDDEMIPKISDFGMAKIFEKNVNEASTSRVVGTFGYMAPEYAMEGLFSVKSDVYSFGVLLLEIITGRKNISFRSPEFSNIIGYAWDMWYTGKGMELADPSIFKTCDEKQVLRCMHIAMLCVQDLASHRPTMSSVVLMLESENVTLPMPREPTCTSMRRARDIEVSNDSHHDDGVSSNNVTMSDIIAR